MKKIILILSMVMATATFAQSDPFRNGCIVEVIETDKTPTYAFSFYDSRTLDLEACVSSLLVPIVEVIHSNPQGNVYIGLVSNETGSTVSLKYCKVNLRNALTKDQIVQMKAYQNVNSSTTDEELTSIKLKVQASLGKNPILLSCEN